MVDTIKFSEMTNAGNINNDDITPSLRGGENVILNNPWTFLPSGTTAQRPAPSVTINFRLRFNTDDQLYEYYDAVLGAWTQLQESAFTQGPFITYTADPSLPDAQNLGALADGILKQSITLGVATLDIAVNGTDYWAPGDELTRTQPPVVGDDVTNKTYVDSIAGGLVASIEGTEDQVLVNGTFGTPEIGAIVLTLPQDIAPTSSPTFDSLTLTNPLTFANGGTNVNAVPTSASASNFAAWDVNVNLPANNFLAGYTTTATAAGTTTLTVASTNQQFFTGVTTQTVVMPVTSTLTLGQQFRIVNLSSGSLTINSSGGNTILTAGANTVTILTCILTSGTTAASWFYSLVDQNEGGGVTSVGSGTGLTGGPITSTGTLSFAPIPATSLWANLTSGSAVPTEVTFSALNDAMSLPINVARNLVFHSGNLHTNPWQRGTTFAGLTSPVNSQTADGWKILIDGSGVATVTKATDAPTVAQAGVFSQFCYNMAVTTADASLAATDRYQIYLPIEGYDFTGIAQRTFTVSFWVKSNKTGTYCLSAVNSGDRSYVAEYTINSANTWEKKTITIPASPSAGTWDYTNAAGISIRFCIAAGSDFVTTAGSWQTGNFIATSNQVNGMDTIGNSFSFQLVQVEPGNVATPYQLVSEQAVLAKCQRYYYKTFPQGVAPVQNVGSGANTATYRCQVGGIAGANGLNIRYPVTMRGAPTLTAYSPLAASSAWYNFSATAASGASSFSTAGGESGAMALNAQVAGDLATHILILHITADASL